MLPVSGAEQLKASLAHTLRPMTSARCAYSRLVNPGPAKRADSFAVGCADFQERGAVNRQPQVPETRHLGRAFERFHDG